MVIQGRVFKSSPLLGKGRDGGHCHTAFSSAKRGVVVIVIQSIFLKSLHLLGNAGDGGHGHIEPSSEELSSSAGKGKGWWSCS